MRIFENFDNVLSLHISGDIMYILSRCRRTRQIDILRLKNLSFWCEDKRATAGEFLDCGR